MELLTTQKQLSSFVGVSDRNMQLPPFFFTIQTETVNIHPTYIIIDKYVNVIIHVCMLPTIVSPI